MLIFWLRLTVSEAMLVSLNNYIEASPLVAREIIDELDVVSTCACARPGKGHLACPPCSKFNLRRCLVLLYQPCLSQ